MGTGNGRRLRLPVGILAAMVMLGASASQALATHLTCGEKIKRSTTLDSNVVDCAGHGIVIGKNNITLDLNGYTIDGTANPDVVGLSAGVFVGDYRGVKIKNGTIREFSNGIWLSGASKAKLTDLVLNANQSFGIVLSGADENRIEDNLVFDNAQGILITAGSQENRVVENTLEGNAAAGLAISAGYETYVSKNTATNNGDDGIRVFDNAAHTFLDRNRAHNNLNDGIKVESEATTLTGNRANNNNFLGIEAVPGVLDGGGNRAKGNLNPFQCINVFCAP